MVWSIGTKYVAHIVQAKAHWKPLGVSQGRILILINPINGDIKATCDVGVAWLARLSLNLEMLGSSSIKKEACNQGQTLGHE